MSETDLQLLQRYTRHQAEDAFSELVRRHLDLVYSAALRQLRSPQLAEEVAQSTFSDLARNATRLASDTILTAWLYQVTRRTAVDVVRRETRRQWREQIASELNAMNTTTADWAHIEPLLDEAMETLEPTDRAAVLLRYFEKKSLREVGASLGTSDDAAQKRVSRAVESLREFFAKRGVTLGASGLVIVISANAIQAAPVGLAFTISTAAALAGTTLTTTATTTAAIITMTTLQKTLITATIAVAVGTGIYEARQASHLRDENRELQKQQASSAEHLQKLQRERDDAASRATVLTEENGQLRSGQKANELLKLRGEVGKLRQSLSTTSTSNPPATGIAKLMNDPSMKEYIHQVQLGLIKERYGPLFKELNLTSEESEKFTQLVGELWLKGSELGSNTNGTGVSQAIGEVAKDVENELQSLLGANKYARYNEFNQEIPARTTVKLLDDSLGANRLTSDQSTHLREIIKGEPYEATHGIAGELDVAFFGSPAEVDQHLQQVAESQQRVLQKASAILTPEQLGALANLQSNSISAQRIQGAALTQKH